LLGSRSAKTLAFFGQGSEAIRKMEEKANRTARPLDELEKRAISLADNGFKVLRRSIDSVLNGVRATFAPTFAVAFDAVTEAVVRNRTAFLTFASDIASKVRPVVLDVIAVLEGRDADVKNSFVLQARDAMVSFGVAADKAINGIIIPALKGLLGVLDLAAKGINSVFGTNLTGNQIAVALIITKVIGLFGLFVGAVKVAIGIVGLFTAAFGAIPVAIAAVGFAIGFFIVRALQSVNFAGFVATAKGAWESIKAGVAGVGESIANAFNTAAIFVSDAFNTSVEFVKGIWNGLVEFFTNLPSTIAGIFATIGQAIVDAFSFAVDTVKGFFTSLFDSVMGIFSRIADRAKQVIGRVREAFGGGNGGNTQGFAEGGMVRGPGTGRSDSILARLSNGEFVMTARAVKKWGVNFMRAINAGVNPLRGFNMGGLVEAVSNVGAFGIPRFADGGMVAAGAAANGTPIYLQMPGGQTIGPMMTGGDVVRLLKQEATRSAIKMAGRGPGWSGAR
jgi:hypothetical protein